MVIENLRAVERGGIGVKVDKVKNAQRHNAGQLVQLAQKECP
jgi:hypothetical protein